jgi:hypothetical protein
MILRSRVWASRCKLARVRFNSPRSNAPICARWNPLLSANTSWVQPLLISRSRIRDPKRRCSCSRCTTSSLEVLYVNTYYLYAELWTRPVPDSPGGNLQAMSDPLGPKSRPRRLISRDLSVCVFRRDGWLCHWCGKPVIFAPAMRHVEQFVRQSGFMGALAYHDVRWRRDRAPLLDHLGAVIDHIQAHSRGGQPTSSIL